MIKLSSSKLIIFTSLFLIATSNISFFTHVLNVYPFNGKNILFILSLGILFTSVNIILLCLLCYGKVTRPMLIIVLLISSLAAYFMDSYHVIIDDKMIENIIKTDTAESLDLLSIKLLAYLILIGILPAALIMQITVIKKPLKIAMISRLKLIASSLIVAVVTILLFGNFYASFFREHKSLRFHANPSYYIYSVGKYLGSFFKHGPIPFQRIGIDAHISALDEDRELVVLVVGETARADHFSLNGYSKKTNPLL
ncbi:MAG: phosphoethanolamine transferase domain-containing protein, partial [Gammaproteobacteria bacterium]